MYGIPLTMYFIAGVFGYNKIFSLEFLLTQVVGQQPFYIVYHYWVFPASKIIIGAGMLLVIFGWYQIFSSKGKLVSTGLYKYTLNPNTLGSNDNGWSKRPVANNHYYCNLAHSGVLILSTGKD
jgi:hypothetical protein